MMKLNQIVLLTLTCLFGTAAQAAPFSYVTLDIFGFTTAPNAINNLGQITGTVTDPDGANSGFVYVDPLDYTTFAFSIASTPVDTFANGINDGGTVVGFYNSGGHSYGFVNDGGVLSDFSSPYADTVLNGINDIGDVVGSYNASGSTNSFVKYNNGPFVEFVFPFSAVYAYAINNDGLIAGSYNDGSGSHGFTSYDGDAYDIIDIALAFAGTTYVYGINDNGDLVGQYNDASGTHGFVRTSDGEVTTLNVPGGYNTVAVGINNAGQVVGTYYDADGPHGFLASPSSIPEPGPFLLIGAGLLAFAGLRKSVWQ